MEDVKPPWERLIDALRALGPVIEIDGGLSVDLDGRVVEIVMTEDDWDDMPTVFGDYPVDEVLQQVRAQPDGLGYLVFNGQYGLEACATPEIPPNPAFKRMKPAGRWFAYNRDGTRRYPTDDDHSAD